MEIAADAYQADDRELARRTIDAATGRDGRHYLHSWPSTTNGYTISLDATSRSTCMVDAGTAARLRPFDDATGCTQRHRRSNQH